MVLAAPARFWPTPHTTPFFLALKDPYPVLLRKFDSRLKRRTNPPKPYLPLQTRTSVYGRERERGREGDERERERERARERESEKERIV
jgi:hypothetical protein